MAAPTWGDKWQTNGLRAGVLQIVSDWGPASVVLQLAFMPMRHGDRTDSDSGCGGVPLVAADEMRCGVWEGGQGVVMKSVKLSKKLSTVCKGEVHGAVQKKKSSWWKKDEVWQPLFSVL